MDKSYRDNPLLLEDGIANLTDAERKAFDFGYVAAICGFLEQIQDSKNRILSKAVVTGGELSQIELLSRIHLLDIYERHYEKRLKQLEKDLQPFIDHL